jgi:hypothetical protein
MASKITAFKTHYTSTEEDEIIPETQYSSEEEEIIPETQFSTNNSPNEKQENNHQQHAKLMQALKDAIAETTRLNTKGGNVPTKVNILAFLQEAASIAQTLTPTTKPNTPNSRNADHRRNEQPQSNERFSSLENDMKEMKGNMSEMKELMLGFSKTYAQAVTTRRETTTGVASSTSTTTREKIDIQKEKERLERQQYEVMLSNHRVPEETKKDIASKQPKELIQILQRAIEQSTIRGEKPTIQAVNKYPNGLRIQCKTADDAKHLKTIDTWSNAFEGLAIHKPKYGFVVHGVSKVDMKIEHGKGGIPQFLEDQNTGITIVEVAPLRRKTYNNENTMHQSIKIFTHDPREADYCIEHGFNINGTHHHAVRYIPQVQITQCYRCHEYGHRSERCTKKQKCGKCSDETHPTNECNESEIKCPLCKGQHPAWHHECPNRKAERQRLNDLKSATSAYFIKHNA